MDWSSEQQAIFSWFKSGKGNLVVEAFAGTGKTSTIKEAFRHAPEGKILYAVFNKRNQKEAQEKITDARVQVRTLHSLGYYFIKQVWENAKPHEDVESDRLASFINITANSEFAGAILKLVSFAKNLTINTTTEQLREICEDREIEQDCIPLALKVLEQSKKQDHESRISFDDMVWLPCAMGIVKPSFDLVTIDEAQDMNLPQLSMAQQSCRKAGRIVVVGDSRQAIYTFRGAVHDAMEMMTITLRASTQQLSTTYRCPVRVVEQAQKIVPDYKAAPTAPTGEVFWTSETLFLKQVKIGDAILSRLNAPLMPMALQLLRSNIPARIEGRDIGKQLITMVDKFKASSVPNYLEKVTEWEAKQIERLNKGKNSEKKCEQTRDIAETLRALAQDCDLVDDIERRIRDLFQDTTEGSRPAVILSSVHKAKGLEFPRVALLSSTFRNGKGNLEEDNIYYVAVTRAQHSLFFLGDGVAEMRSCGDATPRETKCDDGEPKTNGCNGISSASKDERLIAPAIINNSEFIPKAELDRIAREADIALKRAEHIARDKDVYLARGVRPSEDFLSRKTSPARQEPITTGQTESEDMPTKNKNGAGLKNERALKKGEIFGYSAAAVCRALGKMGATKKQTAAIMLKRKIKLSPVTISVQWDSGAGGFNRGEPAPLTKTEFAELMQDAPAAEKEKVKAKTGEKAKTTPKKASKGTKAAKKPAKKKPAKATASEPAKAPEAPESTQSASDSVPEHEQVAEETVQ
jgi:AAA domain/UvrD-like helicase C-terminal domain